MYNKRRDVLRFLGTTFIGAIAGCYGSAGDGSGDDTIQHGTRLTAGGASTTLGTRSFGHPVAISGNGNVAIIGGAFSETSEGDLAGSVHVFERGDTGWERRAKLIPEEGEPGDEFHSSMAISNDGHTAVIGAENGADSDGRRTGLAYVFSHSGGEWAQRAKLAPDDGDEGDQFGRSVAVADGGSMAVITAPNNGTSNDGRTGSAYVFERSGGAWNRRAKLVAGDGDAGDRFGESVGVSDDGSTAIFGASSDADPNGDRTGSAHVFERSNGQWSQRTKLTAEDGDDLDKFGQAIALSNDGSTAFIGAPSDEDPNGSEAGSAYVFEQSNGEWHYQIKIVPDDVDESDQFGYAIAASANGSTAVISAPFRDGPNEEDVGTVYAYVQSDEGWDVASELVANDADSGDAPDVRGAWNVFGASVDVDADGSTAVIGAPDLDLQIGTSNGVVPGSAYVFQ